MSSTTSQWLWKSLSLSLIGESQAAIKKIFRHLYAKRIFQSKWTTRRSALLTTPNYNRMTRFTKVQTIRRQHIKQPYIGQHENEHRPFSVNNTMCTGQRGFYICPCRSTHCPKRGIIRHRLITQGHVYRIEIDTIAWNICDWWIVNGPPEQVLNRYLKPSCQYFTWHTLMVPSSLCPECQATCTEKKEVKDENSNSDRKASRKARGKTPKQ
jgi:hypothetical protein